MCKYKSCKKSLLSLPFYFHRQSVHLSVRTLSKSSNITNFKSDVNISSHFINIYLLWSSQSKLTTKSNLMNFDNSDIKDLSREFVTSNLGHKTAPLVRRSRTWRWNSLLDINQTILLNWTEDHRIDTYPTFTTVATLNWDIFSRQLQTRVIHTSKVSVKSRIVEVIRGWQKRRLL